MSAATLRKESMRRRQEVSEHLDFFRELGVDGVSRAAMWRRREGAGDDPGQPLPEDGSPEANGQVPPEETLDLIRDDLGDCTRCKLHTGRTTLVFGVGKLARFASSGKSFIIPFVCYQKCIQNIVSGPPITT